MLRITGFGWAGPDPSARPPQRITDPHFLYFSCPCVPRHLHARTPPPAYDMLPQYGTGPAPDPPSSSSPAILPLRPASPSLSDLEIQAFGHHVAPLQFSFDPQAEPSSPSLSLPAPLPADLFSHTPIPSDGFFFPDLTNEDVPLWAIDTPSVPKSSQLSVFSVGLKTKGTRAKCAAPPAAAVTPNVEISNATNFEILVWVYAAAKRSAGRVKSKKASKPEPNSYGPIAGNTDMVYDDFTEALAELLGTSLEFLVVSSQEWHWLKPVNLAWLPLLDSSGFNSIIRQLSSPPKGVSKAYIIVRMDEPMKAPPNVSMPWASQPVVGPSSGLGSFESMYCAVMEVDDEPSNDDEHPRKKVPFDQGLEDEKIVWAATIKNGMSTIFHLPLGSNHFNAKAAMKKKPTAAAEPAASVDPPLPLTPAPPTTTPQLPYPNSSGYPPPTPYPPLMGYPPFPGYVPHGFYAHPAQMAPWQGAPRRPRCEQSWDGLSPPHQSSSKLRHKE
ncbi:hypothetical protein B0H10DRAFT_1949342 [Mycena sp. CBHHK59/15]|nr:hypothetical protein B0H10DRAFT_1949342 [Mycena sp. CBHHK59/15]